MKSLQTLIPKLVQATQNGKLNWEEHEYGGYQCPLGSSTVRVWAWSNPDAEEQGISATLYHGRSLGAAVLDSVVANEFDSDHGTLSELFSVARRSALNVDKVISEIEDQLDNL
jgi:hypothetical protein